MTAELGAVLSSLKVAGDMAKAMMGLRDAAMIQMKVIELQGEILSAQSSTFAAQEAQAALLQRVRDLEKEVADLKAWDADKQKYQLTEIANGVFAYVLKSEAGSSEPAHTLCPNCYQGSQKSILQRTASAAHYWLKCPRCQAALDLGYVPVSI